MVLCWRTGWVIELGGTKLRGEMVDVTRSLWLHARGERSRTEILHLLDAIEQNLTQMHHATYKYRVPCLHCIAAGRTAPNQMSVFALEDIEGALPTPRRAHVHRTSVITPTRDSCR